MRDAESWYRKTAMPALAFTLDDAPSVQEPGVSFEAERMDRCRELLARRGISHCVAFVVGSRALGHERALERWLAAGFELGNHTHEHVPASRQPLERFSESLAQCDQLLQRVGAFAAGRPKWFRFPHLDRGCDQTQRGQLARECEKLGYRIAPATIDFFDHPYEAPLAAALTRGNAGDAARVQQRFLQTCRRQLETAAGAFAEQTPALSHIGFVHFGPIVDRNLEAILELLRSQKFEPCSLSMALDHPVYRSFATDLSRSGLVLPASRRDLPSRIRRRLAITAARLQSLGRSRYGPLRPH